MSTDPDTIAAVIKVIGTTLGVEDRAGAFDADTPLLDAMPELDSMAIVELIGALEDHFAIEVDEDDVTGEIFETVGSLAEFVEVQIR